MHLQHLHHYALPDTKHQNKERKEARNERIKDREGWREIMTQIERDTRKGKQAAA